jgi:hypothetical protein
MKRHRLDVFALAAGTFFVVLAIGFLLDGLGAWDVDVTWIAPVLLIALGLAGLVSTVGRASRPVPPAEHEHEQEAVP